MQGRRSIKANQRDPAPQRLRRGKVYFSEDACRGVVKRSRKSADLPRDCAQCAAMISPRKLLAGVTHPPLQGRFQNKILQFLIVGEAVIAVRTPGEILQIRRNQMFFTLRAPVACEHKWGFIFVFYLIFHTIIFACHLKNPVSSIILFKITRPQPFFNCRMRKKNHFIWY